MSVCYAIQSGPLLLVAYILLSFFFHLFLLYASLGSRGSGKKNVRTGDAGTQPKAEAEVRGSRLLPNFQWRLMCWIALAPPLDFFHCSPSLPFAIPVVIE